MDKVGGWEENATSQQPEIAKSAETTYDFPITMNKQVEFYINLFQNKQRGYYERWLARSTKYLPSIKSNLKEAGLPEDLAYLAMIESGYNPTAISKAQAVGLWQFIAGTGKNFGLRIDSWVDERREPEKATLAAIERDQAAWARQEDQLLAESDRISALLKGSSATTALTSSGLSWPVSATITSGFGYRIHPIFRVRRLHTSKGG